MLVQLQSVFLPAICLCGWHSTVIWRIMKVHIVCYEDLDAWILGKFAGQLCKHLNKQGVSADVSKVPDAEADINHHIIYTYYDGRRSSTDTVMVTHIDTPWKLRSLKSQLVNAEMGICM